ncbi:MAG TPA: GAF domain-containing sensor histidine kinase [Anaerolineae bacterium]|nr:GAF domain-containing sensor histidine kinase [Anaerolineae bacterium]HQI85329.1 GAF domain-containing sensor histidine kinase [Anaerolineae bacterium]
MDKTRQQPKPDAAMMPAAPISTAELRAALDDVMLDSLRPTVAVLIILLLVLVYGYARQPRAIATPAMLVTAAALAITIGCGILLYLQKVPPRYANPLGALLAGLVLAQRLVYIAVLGDPAPTGNMVIAFVGAGFLILSTRWLVGVLGGAWAVWVWIALQSPTSSAWGENAFLLVSATALTIMIHLARLNSLRRQELLRFQNESHNRELEQRTVELETFYQTERSRRLLTETLYEVSRALSQTLNLQEVLDLILGNLARIVPFDRGSVMLKRDHVLEIVAAWRFPPASHPLQIRVPIKEGDVFQQICQSKRPLIVPEVFERPDWQQVENLPQARAWAGVPLVDANDAVIGMLSLTRETPRPYTEDEATLALAFAGQAAIALQNARLYSELEEAYAQLERLDQTKSDFITVAAHELRTPLTIIRGYSQMLLKDPEVRKDVERMEMVRGIFDGALRLNDLINSMIDIAKIDTQTLQLYFLPMSLVDLLRDIVRGLREALQERHLTLRINEEWRLPLIEGDLDALKKVFYHLVVNAIKYTPDGGTLTLTGKALAPGDYDLPMGGVEVVVQDTGIGIDPRFHDLIFTKFYQTGEVALHSSGTTKFKGGGPGLGLAIVKGIVEAHGGKVWVESVGYDEATCPGSSFHVVLPLTQPEEQT